jgi:acetyl-CoA synthetase (ADP-forming)
MIAEARRQNRTALDEPAGKRILAAYGVRIPRSARVAGPEQLDNALRGLDPPFALKIISPDIIHKSDFGGVELHLADQNSVHAAMAGMVQRARSDGHRVEGFLVEQMAPPGHNVVIGGVRDPSFGQIIMFGLGGIFVEVMRDVAFRICPVMPIDAQEMIAELRGAPILAGTRGGLAVPEVVLIDALMAIGGENGLLLELADDFAEVDINPLIVSPAGAVAVDARFILTQRVGDDS